MRKKIRGATFHLCESGPESHTIFLIDISGVCNKTPPSQNSLKDGNMIFLFSEQQIETEADPDDDEEGEEEGSQEVDEAKEMEKVKEYQSDLRKSMSGDGLKVGCDEMDKTYAFSQPSEAE